MMLVAWFLCWAAAYWFLLRAADRNFMILPALFLGLCLLT